VTALGYSLPNVVFFVCMDCCSILSAPSWASYKLHQITLCIIYISVGGKYISRSLANYAIANYSNNLSRHLYFLIYIKTANM